MKFQSKPARGRASIILSATLVSAAAVLSGCMGAPTYGTGTSSDQQLVKDLTGVLSVGPERTAEIAYTPRAGLVKPSSLAVLPEPQEDMASAANPAWPESPEERRARLRADATENQDNPAYRSPINAVSTTPVNQAGSLAMSHSAENEMHKMRQRGNSQSKEEERAEIERLLRERQQGDPNSRKYLSEPPVDYRIPSENAAVGDLGMDEWKKERQAKAAAGEKKTWRDYIPKL